MHKLLGPGEYHDCRYIIFWPCQIRFLFQEQVNMNRTENGSSVIILTFPCLMQKWKGLRNIGVSIKRRLPLLLADCLSVGCLSQQRKTQV